MTPPLRHQYTLDDFAYIIGTVDCIVCNKSLANTRYKLVCYDCSGTCLECGKQIQKSDYRCVQCYLKGVRRAKRESGIRVRKGQELES